MIHPLRLVVGAVSVAALLRAGGTARAQTACESLPNPIVVAGSNDFDPVLRQFAAKLALESPPATIISVIGGDLTTSCAAVAGVVTGTDLGGLTGRYYAQSATTATLSACVLSSGRTLDAAISDVFYESCANVPQPKPDDVADLLGPAQATVFVVPAANTSTQVLTTDEARAIFGCGVSSTRKVAGLFGEPMDVYCRSPDAGTRITVARNIGVPESMLIPPRCVRANVDDTLVNTLVARPITPAEPLGYNAPADTLAFIAARLLDLKRGSITPLAFQAPGQVQAYYPDSGALAVDRRNVRDGHYRLWGYGHVIAKTSGGKPNAPAADLIGWMTGVKTSKNLDYVAIEAGEGVIPQCAMRVKRSADGGPLSPYSPADSCSCAYQAFATRTIPVGCTPCTSPNTCGCGSTCRHGFCE